MLRKLIAAVMPALLLICLVFCPAFAQSGLKEGDPAPDHMFPAPGPAQGRSYLGLSPKAENFRLNQVKAEVLVIEFFNRRCRHCQREAPNLNRLFELVRDKGLADRIKFLGIGAYNGPKDVELFQRRYQVPFPLVPDRKLAAFKAYGCRGTPQFFVLRLGAQPSIVMMVSGYLPEPPDALEEITRKSGLRVKWPRQNPPIRAPQAGSVASYLFFAHRKQPWEQKNNLYSFCLMNAASLEGNMGVFRPGKHGARWAFPW